jgi:hypothetical protein
MSILPNGHIRTNNRVFDAATRPDANRGNDHRIFKWSAGVAGANF